MRIVVTGASGNLGTALLRAAAADMPAADVIAVARRAPDREARLAMPARTEWVELNVADDDLAPVLDATDAVVHLAWAFHPAHQPEQTWQTNVIGTRRLLEAAAGRRSRTSPSRRRSLRTPRGAASTRSTRTGPPTDRRMHRTHARRPMWSARWTRSRAPIAT